MASDAVHDINSLVSSKGRDFLIRNNGDQVWSFGNVSIFNFVFL